jgi:LuxR family transcriptional regulator, maltose regulon positive regulatory protein
MTGAPTRERELPVFEASRLTVAWHPPRPKFAAPATGKPHSIRRTELLKRLELGRGCPLILLTAPAGYGKTTLLKQWVEARGLPCAWVTLDRADRDPRILSDSIERALAATGIDSSHTGSFAMVLDDAQVLRPRALAAVLQEILTWLPPGSQLAVASRREPDLGLSRMLADHLVIVINSSELSMSTDEASAALRSAGLDSDSTRSEAILRRSEGWPAALELGILASEQVPDGAGYPDQLTGDHHVLSEYFRAEILAPLQPATVRFLTHSSVLDILSGSQCDQVLDRNGSAGLLADLSRANVPLQPVDSRHECYRLHGLFREMLQTELRRSEPETAPMLHRRAVAWYRKVGDIDRALDHASSAGDRDTTAELLWRELPRYLGEGRSDMVGRWLRRASQDEAAGSVVLAVAAAHTELAIGSLVAAEQWARTASRRLSELPADTAKAERAGVLLIEAWAARSGAHGMSEAAAQGYGLLSDDSPWRASCCLLQGTATLLTGDAVGAVAPLEEGAARGAILAPDISSLCLAQLTVVAIEQQTIDAADLARRARSLVGLHGLSDAPASALVYAVCATAMMSEGLVDQAKADVSRCRALLARLDGVPAWLGAETRILLARASLALGDVAGARELLADASPLARRTADVVVFERWFHSAWDQFDERAESVLAGMASLTPAELRILRFLPTHYSFEEIAQRLEVSSNTVKTHVHAVYRKLNACSRSQAVAHATNVGLLGR